MLEYLQSISPEAVAWLQVTLLLLLCALVLVCTNQIRSHQKKLQRDGEERMREFFERRVAQHMEHVAQSVFSIVLDRLMVRVNKIEVEHRGLRASQSLQDRMIERILDAGMARLSQKVDTVLTELVGTEIESYLASLDNKEKRPSA